MAQYETLAAFSKHGAELLYKDDPLLYQLLEREYHRQADTLTLMASASLADPSVLACEGTSISNVTTEGYPGARFHAGCQLADDIERLAIQRAKAAFQARYANVQPHSGTSANLAVIFGLLRPGATILGMGLDSGGHLTHGARASVTGQYYKGVSYTVDGSGFINYDQVHSLAKEHRPDLIICGASAYPRVLDFKRFRAIADDVKALLLADVSHIAGLIVAGEHPNPIDDAHITTTSTYKQLNGPRGGLILMGKDSDSIAPTGKTTLAQAIDHAIFPFFQGTPSLSVIAAKARALAIVLTPAFKMLASQIVINARVLADYLVAHGYRILTGGSDTHLVLMDVSANGLTGAIAQCALEKCAIIVNKNKIPGDRKRASITSGLRLGTNCATLRGLGENEMLECAELLHRTLTSVTAIGEDDYDLPDSIRRKVQHDVLCLCRRFPIPRYPDDRLISAISVPH